MMGKALSVISKRSQSAYFYQKVEKVISKSKPDMHPLYPTEEKILNRIRLEHPELRWKVKERRRDLEENVMKLRIISGTAFKEGNSEKMDNQRALPRQRIFEPDSDHDFPKSAENITSSGHGFSRLMQMISNAHDDDLDAESKSATTLANKFGIDELTVNAIVQHYAPFAHSSRYDQATYYMEDGQPRRTIEEKEKLFEELAYLNERGKWLSGLERQDMLKTIQKFKDAQKEKETEGMIPDTNDTPIGKRSAP